MNLFIYFIYFLLIYNVVVSASLFDYFLSFTKSTNSENNQISNDVIDQNIPYEVDVVDEKFINEAAHLTGLALSDLDSCQHRVVLKLQQECHSLNDEQVSKLAVMLLNCQSAIEGRPIYPCTEYMSLRECTSSMDPDVWNSYHIMTNRARAVCYAVRQAQFRGLTEMTINKLMHTAHEQLKSMSELTENQHKLKKSMLDSIESVSKGQQVLKEQQEDLQKAQFFGQLAIEDNINQLVKEKALIRSGHEQIAKMTQDVRSKLDETSTQIELQSYDQKNKHKQILEDLIAIQKKTEDIWTRIEQSTNYMLEQNEKASRQYELTLAQLAQVNATVHQVHNLITHSKKALDKKLAWLTDSLGGTGNTIDKLYTCLNHITYLIFSMILCAFLNVPQLTRYAVVTLVPLNLILSLQKGQENAFELPVLTILIILLTIANFIFFTILTFIRRNNLPKHAIELIKSSKQYLRKKAIIYKKDDQITSNVNTPAFQYENSVPIYKNIKSNSPFRENIVPNHIDYESISEEEDAFTATNTSFPEFSSPTPPLSRSDIFLKRRTRSRSNTPVLPNSGSLRKNCLASTRTGHACKNSTLPGRDYCYRHQTGDSIIG